jgi:hypothetical protein
MQIPGMSNAFNDVLEASGLSPVNFGAMKGKQLQLPPDPQQQQPQNGAQPSPIQPQPLPAA